MNRTGMRPISQFWLWRWMFWRRVRCHVYDHNVKCQRPAVFKCIRRMDSGVIVGDDFARDPLCEIHGKPGRCPSDRLATHSEIPAVQRWERVHFCVRVRFERSE